MWNERKMPKRWYELLRERMQVEEQRMRVIRDADVIEDDHLEELLTHVQSLDREMLVVMRQAIAEALAHQGQAPSSDTDSARPRAPFEFSLVDPFW
jgi:hypothetical protein